MKKIFSDEWYLTAVLMIVIFVPITVYQLAFAKKPSRKYWPHTIAELAAEDPHAWHKMHTHVHVEGFVTYTVTEADGDTHIRLCDSPTVLVMDRWRCIVAECIPALPCAKPKVGQRAAVEGISRFDAEGGCVPRAQHCWWEVHPVEKLTILGPD